MAIEYEAGFALRCDECGCYASLPKLPRDIRIAMEEAERQGWQVARNADGTVSAFCHYCRGDGE